MIRTLRKAVWSYRPRSRPTGPLPHEIAESEEEETTKFDTTEDEYFLAWYGMAQGPISRPRPRPTGSYEKPVVVRLPRTPKQKPNYIFTKPPDKDDET